MLRADDDDDTAILSPALSLLMPVRNLAGTSSALQRKLSCGGNIKGAAIELVEHKNNTAPQFSALTAKAGIMARIVDYLGARDVVCVQSWNRSMGRRARKLMLHLRVQPWESAVIFYLRRQTDKPGSSGATASRFPVDGLRALQLMELRDNYAADFAAAISSGLLDRLQSLQVCCSSSMKLVNLRLFVSALSPRSLPELRALDFAGSKLGDDVVADIAALFKKGHFAGLEHFSLARNALQEAGCRKLVGALCHSGCRAKLRSLNLGGNSIAEEGARALFKGLGSDCFVGLRFFSICNNLIPPGPIHEDLLKSIRSQACLKWRVIDLGWNNQIGDIGLVPLFEGIAGRNLCSGLQQIFVQSTNLGDAAATALGALLSSGACSRLTALDVSTNRISADGARALVKGFEGCPRLKRFAIANNDIGAEGIRHISDAFQRGHGLSMEILDLSYTSGSSSIQLLAMAIAQSRCPNLRELSVLDHYHPSFNVAHVFRASMRMSSFHLRSQAKKGAPAQSLEYRTSSGRKM
jgi:Ran GTPase-activating protein (RanGAP) involved in mRNA processing and transport